MLGIVIVDLMKFSYSYEMNEERDIKNEFEIWIEIYSFWNIIFEAGL